MEDFCVHFLRIGERFSFSQRVTKNYRLSQSDIPDTVAACDANYNP